MGLWRSFLQIWTKSAAIMLHFLRWARGRLIHFRWELPVKWLRQPKFHSSVTIARRRSLINLSWKTTWQKAVPGGLNPVITTEVPHADQVLRDAFKTAQKKDYFIASISHVRRASPPRAILPNTPVFTREKDHIFASFQDVRKDSINPGILWNIHVRILEINHSNVFTKVAVKDSTKNQTSAVINDCTLEKPRTFAIRQDARKLSVGNHNLTLTFALNIWCNNNPGILNFKCITRNS